MNINVNISFCGGYCVHEIKMKFFLNLFIIFLRSFFVVNFLLIIFSFFVFNFLFISVVVEIVVHFVILFGIVLCIKAFFIILSFFHPIYHFLHSFDSIFLVFLHLIHFWHILIVSSEVSSEDSLQLLSVFLLDILHIFFKCFLLIGFIDVDKVIDQFLQFLIQVLSIFFFGIILFIDSLDIVIIFLIVRA